MNGPLLTNDRSHLEVKDLALIFDGRDRVVAPPVEELGELAELLLSAKQRGWLGQQELGAELGLGLEPRVEAEVPGAVLVVLQVGELGGAVAEGNVKI